MIEQKYDVIFDGNTVAENCRLDDAMIFIKAIVEAYSGNFVECGSIVGLKMHRKDEHEDV